MARELLERAQAANGRAPAASAPASVANARPAAAASNSRRSRRVDQAQREQFVEAPIVHKLRTRKPTGQVPYPLVLLEGEDKSGRSWDCAELTADPRVGRCFWMDCGEGSADEYAAIPGADYEVIDHDGTWGDILGQVAAVRAFAQAERAAGRPPVVLIIDSSTDLYDEQSAWADSRARRTRTNRERLRQDPDAAITIHPTFWNPVRQRFERLLALLKAFPGIVIVTAAGKEVAVMDQDGNPIDGKRGWKVRTHAEVVRKATLWIRKFQDDPTRIVSARSVHSGVRPGKGTPRLVEGLTLAQAIFDVLGCDPSTAEVRDVRPLSPVDDDETRKIFRDDVWQTAKQLGWGFDRLAAKYAVWADGAETVTGETLPTAGASDLERFLDWMPVPDQPDVPDGDEPPDDIQD